MKSIIYKSESRGHQNHGWLNTYHTFSFANYYNPDRIHFGALRVINDDIVKGGEGFGTHPHDNMEIVTIPLYGELEHQDSMGHRSVIRPGEIQVMSAGSGITHSEYNASETDPVSLFQIWIFPNKKNVKPRYDQKDFQLFNSDSRLKVIVSPDAEDGSLWLHQDVWFSIATLEKGLSLEYNTKKDGNGVFVMVISGKININESQLKDRDAIGIWDTPSVDISVEDDNTRILIIDVPMKF